MRDKELLLGRLAETETKGVLRARSSWHSPPSIYTAYNIRRLLYCAFQDVFPQIYAPEIYFY